MSDKNELKFDYLPGEEWKSIPGFSGYEVSNMGRVMGHYRMNLLQPYVRQGYLRVQFCQNKLKYWFSVHRLVLLAFRGEPDKGQESAHLDGNRGNNRLENLAWVSHKENASHRLIHGTDFRGEKSPNAKLNNEAVQIIRAVYKRRDKVLGAVNLAKAFKVNVTCIMKVVSKQSWVDVPEISKGER